MNHSEMANHIWNIADILRGNFKAYEFEKVVLPFTVLRRFDCIISPHKDKILKLKQAGKPDKLIARELGLKFCNLSKFDFKELLNDGDHIKANLQDYIQGFSDDIKDIITGFKFHDIISALAEKNILYAVVAQFANINLDESTADNLTMGYVFEDLIRRFAEQSNDTAGEHFTPREVIELMVEVLIGEDAGSLNADNKIIKILDPACGTGGMLAVAQDKLRALNQNLDVFPHGQELNEQAYAICKADMLIKGVDVNNLKCGDSFCNDGFQGQTFDYMLANPPYGVDWKSSAECIKNETESKGFAGRFGAGLPRSSDGSLLFLQHMISKMNPDGARIGVVFNGSPLFSGSAGGGESNIRKWIIENDMLEGIIALPDQLFFNTGIPTYIWILTNKKAKNRKGKIRLVNGVNYFSKMRKSLGSKRNEIDEESRKKIVKLYSMKGAHKDYTDFENDDFGYTAVTIERPLRDANGETVRDKKGKAKVDANLRDIENIPLKIDIDKYFEEEVLPHVPDAWIDRKTDKIGYEIPFTRHFYEYKELRSSEAVIKDIAQLERQAVEGLKELLKDA